LKKFSSVQGYHVPGTGITYPKIRTFYRPHLQETKLPQKPSPIPLLVCIHGLGGSIAQFHSLLMSLVHVAPTLAVDLPGCGSSSFKPKQWEAYTTDALVQLLATVIETHRDREAGQQVILIAHSMGCSLAALLASSTSPHAHLISEHVAGVVAICPQAQPIREEKAKQARKACSIPAPLFDLFRKYDRRGGINSTSVLRMTGPAADEETRKLQLRFNKQSRTPVWQRMMYGMLPGPSGEGGLPDRDVWAGLKLPVFLIAGQDDAVTGPDNVRQILSFIGVETTDYLLGPEALGTDPTSQLSQPSDLFSDDSALVASDVTILAPDAVHPYLSSLRSLRTRPQREPSPHPRCGIYRVTVFASPAAHALFYSPATTRTLSALISAFLAQYIDPRLSAVWQLRYLTTEGKWDVKNLEKWKAVSPVSSPIANTFRAMKTLREVDERHSPKRFVADYKGLVRAVVDISHDAPVYDPQGLVDGGIKYHKFPTVSKMPPTVEEVRDFVALVDEVRGAREKGEQGLIGVHCHYGFNRTGFFLVCYMVERLGYRVEEAIEEFRRARAPGIRHAHFVDALHVRYSAV
jgi:pimeloyl-ACP methyl ester carboxylesterase/protein-tyrosine phosphatase